LSALTPAQRAAIERRLIERRAARANADRLVPRPPGAPVPLSFAQQRLWFLHQLHPDSVTYRLPLAVRLVGTLRHDALQQALNALVERHEALRTVFDDAGAEPEQRVQPPLPVEIETVDVGGGDGARRERDLVDLASGFAARPFDLKRGPLFRVQLLKVAPDEHVLVWVLHHIIADVWSLVVLVREFGLLYRAAIDGSAAPPVPALQYGDYACWQRQRLTGDVLARQLDYWRTQLSGSVPRLDLPTDRPRPAVQSLRGARRTIHFPPALLRDVKAMARRSDATLFNALSAAMTVLLSRYSGQDDILLGFGTAGRNRAELEPLVGVFVNTLILRGNVADDPTFATLLTRLRNASLDAAAHHDMPFEMLAREFDPDRDLSRNPLVQVLISVQNMPMEELRLPGLQLSVIELDRHDAHADLTLFVTEVGDGAQGVLEYDAELFEPATIDRMATHLLTMLAAAAADASQPVSALALMPAEEVRALRLSDGVAVGVAPAEFVDAQVRAHAALNPDAIAVTDGEVSYTYRELDARAAQLARQLQQLGVTAEVRVPVLMHRCADGVVALLAVLKAGGAYVPLDPALPDARIAFALDDTRAPVILTQARYRSRLQQARPTPLICVDALALAAEAPLSGAAPRRAVAAENLAYVIYTSGSTGQPKGVEVTHAGLANLIGWHRRAYDITPRDRATHLAGVGFDASVWEIWPYLSAGASVHIPPAETLLDPQGLWRYLEQQRITVCFMPTPLAETALRHTLPEGLALKALLTGGDRLTCGADRAWPFLFVNHYGPTENSVVATAYTLRPGDPQTPPIGRGIDNVTLHVLDRRLHPVPCGVHGELFIGGPSLARGYQHRPDLTAERFIPNPFSAVPGARLYRTGDVVRRLPTGELEFVGRNDHQVKIRGFRIEIGEIESAIRSHAAVVDAVVQVRGDGGDARLVAYVVPSAEGTATTEEELRASLRASLKDRLPEYMVPAVIVVMAAFPLSPNGKIDRRALPPPGSQPQDDAVMAAPPRSGVERVIAEVWCEVLGCDRVSVHDNFFDLGGHSLLLIRVHTELRQRLQRPIAVVDLFKHPTVASLAGHLAPAGEVTPAVEAPPSAAQRAGGPERWAEPIAIVGMAGRFPGAGTIEDFWDNLRRGVESIRFFDAAELAAAGVPAELLADPRYVRARGVVADADKFDAGLFGYTPREAEIMDPQQRVFLECAWEALEHAGCDPEQFAGPIGVFAGTGFNSYLRLLASDPALADYNAVQLGIASDKDFLATRVAYKLNLRGPSLAVQTACSTSLVAVHIACRSLQSGDCAVALAGGVRISVPQESGYQFQEGSILSPDGRCRVFDAGARGTVSGNGAAIVVLKRLADAIADGDTIHAVIVGSAVNNDGSQKVGFTAPGVEGQAAVIRAAHRAAGVDPRSIGYVEAHGTGTVLGDPVEVAALTAAFGTDGQYCALGSVKSNLGHLDAAAGVAGLIKATLSVERGELVPTLHYSAPNPAIEFARSPFRVNTAAQPWHGDGPRRAGVSSFGLGGTNAHVVIEQGPACPAEPSPRRAHLIVQSARTPEALDRLREGLARALEADPALDLGDVAHTLQVGRKALGYRSTVVCRSHEEAVTALRTAAPVSQPAGDAPLSTVFMFSGQGAQRVGMMRELYDLEPVFRAEVDRCAEILLPITGIDVRHALYPDDSAAADAALRLQQTAVAQPALFAVEYALARLWMSWGVRPAAMIGHSIGEYVAACLAGVMSLDSALGIVAARGRLMQQMPAGAMIAVPLDEAAAASLVGDEVSIAAVNAPGQVVLSGPLPAITDIERRLGDRGVTAQRLQTSHAFHSPMMQPVLASFREHLAQVPLNRPALPFISNVTGTWIDAAAATSPEYWVEHLRGTVRFADGIRTLAAENGRAFLEVGPGQALATLAKHSAPGATALPSLARGAVSDAASVMAALGRLWTMGAKVEWAAVYAGERRRRIALPTYPFERTRYWRGGSHLPAPQAASVSPAGSRLPIEQWRHVASWTSTPPVPALAIAGTCLILVEDEQFGDLLAEQARARGADPIVVRVGKPFEALGTRCTIDPRDPADYRALWSALVDAERVPAHVIHAAGAVASPGLAWSERLAVRFSSAVLLLQAAVACNITETFALSFVTNGVHDIAGDEELDAATAMLLALARVAPHECPNVRCRAIDWQHMSLAAAAAAVVGELTSEAAETVVAYRHSKRWVQTFARLAPSAPRHPKLRNGGIYLITGGTGGIGLEIARRLADDWDATVVLLSRRLPQPRSDAAQRVAQLTERGRRVHLMAADVADGEALRRAVERIVTQFGDLHGVIHAAGADKSPVPLSQLDEAGLQTQLAPRLDAVAALDTALGDRELDFCIVGSSIGAVLGVVGHAAYTAAHIAMDTFVARRNRTAANRWTIVNWDNWVTWKSAAERASGESLSADEGWTVLGDVLARAGELDQVLVSTVDLTARSQKWAERGDAGARREALATHARPALASRFAAPDSDAERILCRIWEQLLGIAPIGVHDNFFELGGDSVIGIQVVSKAAAQGVRLSAGQLFEHQTVAELATALEAPQVAANVDTRGPAPLTPIQHWFFEQDFANPQHFNQARLVGLRRPVAPSTLHTALAAVVEHHDALRLRFSKTADGWRQEPVPSSALPFHVVECGEPAAEELAALIERQATALHAGFDFAAGRVFGAVYVNAAQPGDARLLLAAHHLAVDAVSWRIILDDLETACAQLLAGQPVRLPAPSASYSTWAHALTAAVPKLGAEAPLWLAQARATPVRLPRDFGDGTNLESSTASVEVTLSAADTELVLRRASDSGPGAGAIDVLVTALATSVLEWAGGDTLRLALEGHGRESIADGVEVSRTVGWFTALHPVTINLDRQAAAPERLTSVSRQLRAIPRGGLGYGVLRHLGAGDVAATLAQAPPAEVMLLYLGRLDAAAEADGLFTPAVEPTGRWRDGNQQRSHVVECTALVAGGALRLRWSYSASLHRPETIRALADRMLHAMRELIHREAAAAAPRPSQASPGGSGRDSQRRAQVLSALQRSGRK
jgi:amino acid adenylation domain-containing protein/non-ribosomal peptide synthase protein (TIGR01720 family)